MEYRGKLYGKISNKYFDTSRTTEDWDSMLEALKVFVNFPKEDLESWIDEGTSVTMTVRSADLHKALEAIKKATE